MKRFVYPALFLLFGIYVLLIEMSEYLCETSDMTPFYITDVFVHDMTSRCGGLLAFAASFLQSCLAIPRLGASCLLLLLLLLPYMWKKLFGIADSSEALCWIPSFAMLANYTQLGYMIYVLKSPAPAFSMPLGLFAALLLAWVFRFFCTLGGIAGEICKVVWIIAVAALGYYAIGCYAWLSLLIAVVFLWKRPSDGVRFNCTFPVILTLLVVASFFVPLAFYESGLLQIRRENICLVGLPDYRWTDTEKQLWYPALSVVACLLLFCTMFLTANPDKRQKSKPLGLSFILSGLLFVGAGCLAFSATCRDMNYKYILRMKQAVDKGEWRTVLDVADCADRTSDTYVAPTRLQVLFTRLALYRLGRAADDMFRYPDGDTPYMAQRTHQYLRLIGGRSLYFYYGKLNYSYRWCMEDMVEYGMRPDYLKYMLRCAVLNGEESLARKYADMLRSNPFCRDFVEQHYGDKLSASVSREYAAVRKLLNYATVLDGDGGLIEVYLLNSYAMMEGGSREMVDLSLLSCLVLKDMEGFWPRFFRLLPTFAEGRIPRHYQEAVLLFSQLKPGIDISGLPIDAEVRERFERLVEASANNAQYGDEYNRLQLRSSFGDTYWYYYFFTTGLKTN